MQKKIKTIFKNIIDKIRSRNYSPEMFFDVERFFKDYQNFRNDYSCAKYTGYPVKDCATIRRILYQNNLLGNYFFSPKIGPWKFMQEEIHYRIPNLNTSSTILEVGPGEHPVFSPEEYQNWFMCDINYDGKSINFKQFTWAKKKYPPERCYTASWDTMADVLTKLHSQCDLVFGCHSYEHTFKPVTALQQAYTLLKPGGWLAMFVPDGFSDDPNLHDPTHTLYVVPGMMEDFFHAAGGFAAPIVEPFRPNADLIILAQKEQ